MRTTLTLEDDLARQLKKLARRDGRWFKEVLNETLRRGLTSQEIAEPAEVYDVQTFRSGFRAGVDPLRLNQLVDELETVRAALQPAGRGRR